MARMHGVTLGQWMEPDERCAYVAIDDVDGRSPPLTPDIWAQWVREPLCLNRHVREHGGHAAAVKTTARSAPPVVMCHKDPL
jgi:hypothetical protein